MSGNAGKISILFSIWDNQPSPAFLTEFLESIISIKGNKRDKSVFGKINEK